MKAANVLSAVLLLAATASAANAQQFRLSWNSCDPWVPHQDFLPSGPGPFKLVLSITQAGLEYCGHDNWVTVGPAPIPDAWRFDDPGCQGSAYISYSTAAFSKTCPAFRGARPLWLYDYRLQPDNTVEIRLSNVFDFFTPSPTTRYTLWMVTFDHTYSVAGAGTPGLTCGGADLPVLFIARHQLVLWSGQMQEFPPGPEDVATWNGGPVAAQPSTWGRVKGLYR